LTHLIILSQLCFNRSSPGSASLGQLQRNKTPGMRMMLLGKPEVKRLLGRPRCKWEGGIIKMNVLGMKFGVVDWIEPICFAGI
jgi:hypothetical protein